MGLIAKLDGSLAVTRPLWLWFGQVSLIVLGTHLAADRMDDALGTRIALIPWGWEDPETPFFIARWVSVAIEVLVTLWAIRSLFRTTDHDLTSWRRWAERCSLHNLSAPLFWLPVSLAGSWSIAMAIEDALPLHTASTAFAWGIAAVVFIRLGFTAVYALLHAPPPPKHRLDGLFWLPPLALVAGYAAWFGLPIWGWR